MTLKLAGGRTLSDEIWGMDANPAPSKAPRALVALIVLWTLVELFSFLVSRDHGARWPGAEEDRHIAFVISDVLQFIYAFLMVALIGYGLTRRLRFVWIAAFVWQGLRAGFGLITLTLNDFAVDAFTDFTDFSFYGVVLPLTVAVVSFALLLLPSTRAWIRSD